MLDSISEHNFRFLGPEPKVAGEHILHNDGDIHMTDDPKSIVLSPPQLFGRYSTENTYRPEGSSSTSSSYSSSSSPSPTTTLSLPEDSSMTETSPGSSPESPSTDSLAASTIDTNTIDTRMNMTGSNPSPPENGLPGGFFDSNRSSLAAKRPKKNLKNLAVNTTGNTNVPRGAATSVPTLSKTQHLELPTTLKRSDASFTKPDSPPKRRPSNLSLTIVTPASNNPVSGLTNTTTTLHTTTTLSRPHTLRHHRSSPHLPRSGGSFALKSPPPILTNGSNISSLERSQSDLQNRYSDDGEFDFDIPQSREEKPEAYPDGPICVVDPYLDLYLEPTADQARKYDVVFNVASEVRNPFLTYSTPDPTKKQEIRLDGGGGLQYAPRRGTNPSEESNKEVSSVNAIETSPEILETHIPHAGVGHLENVEFRDGKSKVAKEPEYIHIPWEHNTDIVPDLIRLVKIIDDRIRDHKKVLIHCQCGVSRSATLVVAYCLYKQPSLSVQEAYDLIKKRSKWIGPNMNLIMQLQEFQSRIALSAPIRRGLRSMSPIEAKNPWNSAVWRQSANASTSASILDFSVPKTVPMSATLPSQTFIDGSITPGPNSAPSGARWPNLVADDDKSSDHPAPDAKDSRASSVPHVSDENKAVPHLRLSVHQPMNLFDSLKSPRSDQFAMNGLCVPSRVVNHDEFGIMSPSTGAFPSAPIDREKLLNTLGMGSAFAATQPRQTMPINTFQPLRMTPMQILTGGNRGAAAPQSGFNLAVPSTTIQQNMDTLRSPRANTFLVPSFLGQTRTPVSPGFQDEDPRSPPQENTHTIINNIASVL